MISKKTVFTEELQTLKDKILTNRKNNIEMYAYTDKGLLIISSKSIANIGRYIRINEPNFRVKEMNQRILISLKQS